MNMGQLALIESLPAEWQELILDHEAKKWIESRKSVLEIASRARSEGAHILFDDLMFRPDALPEPLQSRVQMMLALLPLSADDTPRF